MAVRELDLHDTFLAADYSHPGDNIPPMLAVAQHCGLTGADLVRGLATGYEIQVDLVKGDLPARAQDRSHRPSRPVRGRRHRRAAGACSRDDLSGGSAGAARHHDHAAVAQGRDHRAGRPMRRRFAGKLAIEAVDRVMRGEGAPSPIYEGEDGVIAWLLGGPKADYTGAAARDRANPSAPSWTPTPRNTRPSTRARR